jgi:hypothetical protein
MVMAVAVLILVKEREELILVKVEEEIKEEVSHLEEMISPR